MPKEVSRAESQADQIRVAAERLVAKHVPQGLPPAGSESEAEVEESLRRLARALIASALDAYETQRLAEPSYSRREHQRRKRKGLDLGDGGSVQVDGSGP